MGTIRLLGTKLPPKLTRLGTAVVEIESEVFDGIVEAMRYTGVFDESATPPLLPEWPPENLDVGFEREEQLFDLLSDAEADDTFTADDATLEALVPTEGVTPDERDAMLAYLSLKWKLLAKGSAGAAMVPLYKFQQLGWHITPVECRAIAQKLSDVFRDQTAQAAMLAKLQDRLPVEGVAFETVEWLPAWCELNAKAAECSGYVVD